MRQSAEPTIVKETRVVIAGVAFLRRVWSDHSISLAIPKKLTAPLIPSVGEKRRRTDR